MKNEIHNFIYPEISHQDRWYGANIQGQVLRQDGNWRDYLPPTEDQNIRDIESSACYIEAQQHSLATLLEEQFGLKDQNFSARFNALLSDGTQHGGDPIKGAKSIKYDGMVDDAKMPFDNSITCWDDFHSWKGVNKDDLIVLGKQWTQFWTAEFVPIIEKEMPLATKYVVLKQWLKSCPCPISVTAWYQQGDVYIKPEGLNDNHLVEAYYVDDQNRIYIRDTYAPYQKILAPNFNFDFAMAWTIKKNDNPKEGWLWTLIKSLFKVGSNPTPQHPEKLTVALPSQYLWDTQDNARHSVRLICDEMLPIVRSVSVNGKLYMPKDIICAVIMGESQFYNDVVNKNKDPKTGQVTSTDWGICQINDYWHIGQGKDFPSVQYVLDNPEMAVRWMINMYKAGKINLWCAYVNGSYKRWL